MEQAEPLEPNGPFLSAAFLCERVLTEQDGVASFIRVVDRKTHRAVGPGAPEEMPELDLNWWLVVAFKAGAARGRSALEITIEAPSGLRLGNPMEVPVLFEGDDRGVNVVAELGLKLREEGLYWIRVRLDGLQVTRIPFRLVYERLGGSSATPRP